MWVEERNGEQEAAKECQVGKTGVSRLVEIGIGTGRRQKTAKIENSGRYTENVLPPVDHRPIW